MSNLANADKAELDCASWVTLIANIGLPLVNEALDSRINQLFIKLQELASSTLTNAALVMRLEEKQEEWQPAKDQYMRTVLHLAALNGNTKLCCCLVLAGAHVNAKDGIHQTPLTLSLHKNHINTSKFLVEIGSNVLEDFFKENASPLEIAKLKKMDIIVSMISLQGDNYTRGMSAIFWRWSFFKCLINGNVNHNQKDTKVWTSLTTHPLLVPLTTLGF
jgi:ankyrin repeat protein